MKNRLYRVITICLLLTPALAGCGMIESLFNPFSGKWKSGAFELEFKSDKTFELAVGKTISINLDGTYAYDDSTLTLDIDGSGDVAFTYSFSDDKRKLVLTPKSDFEYIRTRLEFTRQ